MVSLQKEINDLQSQKEEIERQLEKKLNELKFQESLGPEFKLAELIHSNECHFNHTDGCGWYYESWRDYEGRYARIRYLNWARKFIEAYEGSNPSNPYDVVSMFYASER